MTHHIFDWLKHSKYNELERLLDRQQKLLTQHEELWRKMMADNATLISAVRDFLTALQPLIDKANGDKATIQALNDEISALNAKAAADAATNDQLIADLAVAKAAVVSAGEVGGSMAGNV
jgi:DNA repair exonuclease SbcCD ATPase subunit